MSVTLLDHGTLQDASLFFSLFGTVIRSTVSAGAQHPRKQKINEINDLIAVIQKETKHIQGTGHSIQRAVLGGASVNIGQLAIYLIGAKDVAHFVSRINARVTFNTGNPLRDFHYLLTQGLIK